MWDGDVRPADEPGPMQPAPTAPDVISSASAAPDVISSAPTAPVRVELSVPTSDLTPIEVAADLAVLEVIERELGDVDAALRRLDDDSYDTCERCGTRIDESVLASAPLTRHCGRCGTGAPTLFDGPATY